MTRANLSSFKQIFDLCERIGAVAWHIFLLVPTGRAAKLGAEVITAEEYEEVLNWFYDFENHVHAPQGNLRPHYYRIMRQRAKAEGIPVTPENFGLGAMTRGCLGGTGFFISHPVRYSRVAISNLIAATCAPSVPEIWRTSKQFLQFRNQRIRRQMWHLRIPQGLRRLRAGIVHGQ